MGIGIARIYSHRQLRRLAAILVVGVCMTSLSWARTPGPYFASLRSGDAAAFDNVPVLMIRTYLSNALATYAKACPEMAPPHAFPWALAAYLAKVPPQHGRPNLGILGSVAIEGNKMVAWTAGPGNAENDVLWIVEQSSCTVAAHRTWIENVMAFAQDPRIAGPFPQAQALCEESGASPSLCACFAMSYDMEATPAERRRVLEGQSQIEGLRATLRNDYLSARVTYKCEASPPIANPGTEYLLTSDEQHRLREGTYRMYMPLARNQAGVTCALKRQIAWRYVLNCTGVGLTGLGSLSSSGDSLRVHYRGHKPDEVFRVLADGTLRLQSNNPQVAMDLLPSGTEVEMSQAQDDGAAARRPIGAENAPAGSRAPNQANQSAARGQAATPERCASMLLDIQRLRSKATSNPRVIETLEFRYAQYCSR